MAADPEVSWAPADQRRSNEKGLTAVVPPRGRSSVEEKLEKVQVWKKEELLELQCSKST